MDQNLLPALTYFGLSDKEAALYLVLLQTGQQTAYAAAIKSGLKKATTYVILEELVHRGVVHKIPKPKAVLYTAVDPVELFVSARAKAERAETALPQLRALYRSDTSKVTASFYEGIDGIQDMFKQLIERTKGKEHIAFYAHQKDTPKALQDYWQELNKEYLKHKIKRRAITTLDQTIKDYLTSKVVPKEFLKFKPLSAKKYSSNISIEVYGKWTQIISHRYLQGILIENPDIADVMRQIFELIWEEEN